MHLAPLIEDLAIILAIAGLMSFIFQKIHQPVVLGYIIAGIIIGPYTPPFKLITDLSSIQSWAELGVIFLMFTLGLEFSFRKLTKVGGSAIVTVLAEALCLLPMGFLLGKALGWQTMDCLFLGAMLSISSTTIIIKALEELDLKKHRFAELIFGVLIVEDLFAILLLVALGTVAATHQISPLGLLTAVLKLILVVSGWFITGYFLVPKFITYVGKTATDEMLTLVSLGLCLAMVVFANYFHYSSALGAFIMGSILAETPALPRIEKNMTSLRNLFGAIFFVSIGMLIDPQTLWEHQGSIAILCCALIAGKILIASIGSLLSGQTIRNSVQVGFGLAQIGEFSFIIAQLGMSLKVTSEFLYPVAVAVSLVTTFTTPYLIRISAQVAHRIEDLLPLRVRDVLNRYAAQAEARRAGAREKTDTLSSLIRWSVNGLTISILFIVDSEFLLPALGRRNLVPAHLLPFIGWATAVIISSPFIWGMLSAFRPQEFKT
ncbi:MAG: cation:proton antiporter, partial [Bdellovibrionia bacterium]